jgi:SAM-dependent methyltransferase
MNRTVPRPTIQRSDSTLAVVIGGSIAGLLAARVLSDFFDRVVSSLLFHHLSRESKERTLDEVFRVLRPGGEFHMVDWGRPRNAFMRVAFLAVQLLDGFPTTRDNVNGLLPRLLIKAGFQEVREIADLSTVAGTLSLYSARKPQDDSYF